MEEHVQVFIKRWALRHFESLTCLYEISETNPLKEKDGEDPEGISFSAPEGAIFIFSWGSSVIPKQLYLWICDAALMKRNRSFKYIQKIPPGWDYPQTVILHRSWEKVVSKSWIEQSVCRWTWTMWHLKQAILREALHALKAKQSCILNTQSKHNVAT